MRWVLLPLLACMLFPAFSEASLVDPLEGDVVPGQIVVSGQNLEELRKSDLQEIGAEKIKEIIPGEAWLLRLEDDVSIPQGIRLLEAEKSVEIAEPDYRMEIAASPSDTLWGSLWGLENSGQSVNGTTGIAGADISALEAWELEKGSSGGVTVGIIDTGIDLTHSDLQSNAWSNPDEIKNNNIDDDGNGYIDDASGWNWVSKNNNTADDNFHGTHVAGTVAARGNNNQGVVGVSWGARLAALKVLGASGGGSMSNVLQAVDYAGREGMPVVNASLAGGGFSQTFLNTLQNYPNTLYVFAAGNEGQNIESTKVYPCSYNSANVVCVGASTQRDALASFSNWGATEVDLVAPGSNTLSTLPRQDGVDRYGYSSGTSMAAPHVAGVAALMRQYRKAGSAAEHKDVLMQSVQKKSAFDAKTVSGGRLDAYSALLATGDRFQNLPPTLTLNPSSYWISTVSPTFSFSISGASSPASCSLASGGTTISSGACASAASHTWSALDENREYIFTVSATNEFGTTSRSHTFRIDASSPSSPQILEGPATNTSSRDASWLLRGEDEATFECRLGGSWGACSESLASGQARHSEKGLADGTYTFRARQRDRAGNLSPEATSSFSVDTLLPPAPTLIEKPQEWAASTTATIRFAVEGTARCSLDEGQETACSSPLSLSNLSQGSHRLQVRDRDAAGNISSPLEVVWNVDTVAPPAPTVTGPSGTTAFRNITFSLSGESNASFLCARGENLLQSCQESVSYQGLADGSFRFRARQRDRAGNLSPETVRDLTITSSGGEVVLQEKPAAMSNDTTPLFRWTLSSPSFRTLCSLGEEWSPCSNEKSYSLPDGSYVFRLRLEDEAGSWFETSYAFSIDTVLPTVNLSSPPSISSSRSIELNWSSPETLLYRCKLDSAPESACTSPLLLTNLSDGTHTFSLRARDAAGNEKVLQRSWSVDVTPPKKPSLGLLSGSNSLSRISISGDEGSAFFCTLEGESESACTSPWSRTLSPGEHKLLVRARDMAGNFSESTSLSWSVGDGELPTPSLQGPLEDGTILLEGAEEGMDYLCAFAGEDLKVCPQQILPKLTNGTYSYRLRIREGVRLSREVSGQIQVSGTPQPPAGQVGISINAGGLYTNDSRVGLRLVWPAGTRSVLISKDGSYEGNTVDPSEEISWNLPLGGEERLPRVVYVRFFGAGNEILYSGSDDIILDTRPPAFRSIDLDRRGKYYRLRVQSTDPNSGLRFLEVASGGFQNKRRLKAKRMLTLQGQGSVPRWVRISDRAGNWSSWAEIKS